MTRTDLVFIALLGLSLAPLIPAGILAALDKSARSRPRTVMPQWVRPQELDIAELAFLERRWDHLTEALLLDLARRDRIRVSRTPSGGFLIEVRDLAHATDVERKSLEYLHGPAVRPGSQRELDLALTPSGLISLTMKYRADAMRNLRMQGLVSETGLSRARARMLVFTAAVWALALVAGLLAHRLNGFSGLALTANLAAIGSLIAQLFLGAGDVIRPTATGVAMIDRLEGIRQFMRMPATERLAVMRGPNGPRGDGDGLETVYESLLPLAVLWGLESEWIQALREDLRAQPEWWLPDDDFAESVRQLGNAIGAGGEYVEDRVSDS